MTPDLLLADLEALRDYEAGVEWLGWADLPDVDEEETGADD